jgi:murein L,D-transpeptidase YafK
MNVQKHPLVNGVFRVRKINAELKKRVASGGLGPKLGAGDRQGPERIYAIESLNPNSLFHLSMRLNYPNEFDQMRAKQDGRSDLGGDIMIHGSTDRLEAPVNE